MLQALQKDLDFPDRGMNSYQQDLIMAAEFQQAVLPEIVKLEYLDISVLYQPFDMVSGDVYDFVLNREQELAIFVGDATGHGIPAALMTMMVHIAIDSLTPNLATDESIRCLNKMIANRYTGRSVSGAFFRVSPDGLLKVTHAGHPSIIIMSDNDKIHTFDEAGCALGLFADEPVTYIEESYQLESGDKIIAFSDGLYEWRNANKESYGLERLHEIIKENSDLDCNQFKEAIFEDVNSFARGSLNNDDLTLLVVEYKNQDSLLPA